MRVYITWKFGYKEGLWFSVNLLPAISIYYSDGRVLDNDSILIINIDWLFLNVNLERKMNARRSTLSDPAIISNDWDGEQI